MSNIFNDITEGNLDLTEENDLFTEAVYPDSILYLKTLRKKMTLPQGTPIGKGNLCFLYSRNIDESIHLMTSKNFLNKNRYRYYYYNFKYVGKLYNRRYRFNDREDRKEYYKKVEDATSSIMGQKVLTNTESNNRNMYYEMFRYINIFENICGKLQPKRYVSLYWEYMNQVYKMSIPGYNKRFVLVDLSLYTLKKTLKENLRHPLYIIYYTLFRYPDLLKDINIDYYFYAGNSVLKINPSMFDDNSLQKLRTEMKRIMTFASSSAVVDKALSEEEIQKDEIIQNTVSDVISVTSKKEDKTITTTEELVKLNAVSSVEKEVEVKAKETVEEKIPNKNTSNSSKANIEDDKNNDENTIDSNEIVNSVKQELDKDRELIEKIYHQSRSQIPSKSEASTARDRLLQEKQKEIKIGNATISELESIESSKITIPVLDVSKNVSTTNDHMKEIRFQNLDKTYNEKLMKKDIANSITSLNNKSIPMFVRDIKVEDSSDELNYKDTYTILLEDGNRKRHTVKVDIPKFIDDRFLYIGGNKKIIKHQNFLLPVVKIAPDMVQIVTNYSKMSIQRVENRSTSSIERLKKAVNNSEDFTSLFNVGNVFTDNSDYVTTIEYDDLSKHFSSFKSGRTKIFFNQKDAHDYMKKNNIPEKKNKMFIGKYNGEPCYIDIDTQEDGNGNSITDIIIDSVPETIKSEYSKTKAPKQLMYARVKVMAQFVSVAMLLGLWEGISSVLKKLKVEYRLENKVPTELKPNEEFIVFKDCVMVYKQNVQIAMVMNGFKRYNTKDYNLEEFDEKTPYLDYIKKQYGKAIIENALMNFYEFAIDPITLEILKDQNLPEDIVSLFIYAINLLADSQYVVEINQGLSRVRCNEIIPAILYDKIAKNYVSYRNYNGRKKFSIPQDCVIKEILKQKTVEDYSTLNPTLEMEMTHAISSKGFRGVNLDDAYTIPKRSYDPSMIGVIAPSTSPDGSVGISKTLSMEPSIKGLRGYTENNQKSLDKLNDVNLFSPGELSIPLATTIDDPNRLGHALKQSKHVIPVTKASPVLISNGLEEVARFHLTSNFVINADEDGEIIDYDEESKIMIAKYKSGKCRAIDLSANIVKNGGGGFFLSNILKTDLTVGSKFKKNDVLAYHKDFFKNDTFNNCRMVMGTLAKVAIMSTYNTYEDSTVITHKLSKEASTEMCFCKPTTVGKNSNVFYMVKKGQEISVGDPLIQFDTSYEDESINALLANLAAEEKDTILEGARNEVKSKYSGVIEDIKIYSAVDLEEMSPSLKKIVSKYYKGIDKKKEFLNKYDPESKTSIVKCGMLVNEASHKLQPNRFGLIKGEHVEDSVLIEFYIKHTEPLEIGSKIANFTALKNTVGEIIPEGYEPWSEHRPDEEISTMIASNSILNRMTPSILLTALGNKCIIELKRTLEGMNFDREKMESTIYKFFNAFDKTGNNTKRYKELFHPMTDIQFKRYFQNLFDNEDAYLILDIVDYERSITMDDIERAAKTINVPLFEYVYLPHLTMDKSRVIVTKEKVPVGYINIKRTQQTVMKKNGISTDISQRSAITNQVTGKDKNGRQSDLENTMLTALGMTNTLKELNAPRADDEHMKQQMLRDISINGYTRLEDMDDDIQNKTTLNTVDCFILGMSLKSDLVTKGLMTNKTLKDEL